MSIALNKKKFTGIRPLYAQIIFTILAFTAMVSASYYFAHSTIHGNLMRIAESGYAYTRMQLESDLAEPKLILRGFSQTARSMVIRGDSADAISEYIKEIAWYFHSSGTRIMSSVVLFGYFESFGSEPVFIISDDSLPDGYVPTERPWFKMAVENCGSVVETHPSKSVLSDNMVITYARCIHDENDERIGIIGVEVKINDIARNVVDIALTQGSYGILIAQDLSIIAHTNPRYIGKDMRDPSISISIFADEMIIGSEINEGRVVNWLGEQSVAFFRKLPNGWYLGLLTSNESFYQNLTKMAFTLVILGIIFALTLILILIRIDTARVKSDMESRHKSAFLANMSHEIRTPMNAIIGMTTIGITTPDHNRKNYCFTKIGDASNHLLGVINDILDMSKIEANKFELLPIEFNLEKMLQRVVNVINFRIDEKKQRFMVHIDSHIPDTLIGDEQRIAQVVTNLLGNAIKFTPEEGSIDLKAHFVNEEKDGLCTIEISVSDNGIGMTGEQQARIFNSFEQAETSTTRKYGGTGLGLPISKNIVEMMDGRIWVESEINKGSTFGIVIKMKKGTKVRTSLLPEDVNLDNVRIMVVDDDKYILDYFEEISHEFRLKCDFAESGKEAIGLLEKNGHYHIYFVDWKMPGMDGIQLTAELKAHHESAKSVIIMISSAEWTTVEAEARKAGVDKFLSKPLFPSAIADAINEALGIDHKKIEKSQVDIDGIFAGQRILLAEDVEINREIVKTLLEPTCIEIDCAENGAEAVRKFSEEPYKYDMIFMDVQMPVMDGYEATRSIRSLRVPQAQTICIIAMTANVFREDIEKCMEAGMNSHLGKPLNFDDVISTLRRFLPVKQKSGPEADAFELR
ncbi:MAG: response regulator [Treponema sp.]|nr:response regulator [Treponema sp.]